VLLKQGNRAPRAAKKFGNSSAKGLDREATLWYLVNHFMAPMAFVGRSPVLKSSLQDQCVIFNYANLLKNPETGSSPGPCGLKLPKEETSMKKILILGSGAAGTMVAMKLGPSRHGL